MIVPVILPLLALVAIGWLLGRWRHADPAGVADVILYLFMPLLMFASLVRDPVTWGQTGRYLGWYLGYVLIMWGVAVVAGRLLRWPQPLRAALGLVLTGINVGSYGVPVVLSVVGEQALSGAMLLLVASNATAGSLGVYLAAGGRLRPTQAAKTIFRLPLIYAVVGAVGVQISGLHIPSNWLESAYRIGMTGPTLALVVLGLQLSRVDWSDMGKQIGFVAFAKLAIGSCVGLVLAVGLGAQGDDLAALAVMGCLPCTINSVLLSLRFDARPDFVGGACLLTTLMSPVALLVALNWLGRI
jgi:predicted permease